MKEQNAYILGTEKAELHRLGLQHQVWASEAQKGWNNAGFSAGQTLLDLGCGPGFCTKEMAYIVGETGKVIGIDKSQAYINYLNQVAKLHALNIETQCSNFDQMSLSANSLDGMYCRWALAWIDNPEAILQKVINALKTGGKIVVQEYYDWTTHQIEPKMDAVSKAIKSAFQSFEDSEGNINIGRVLPNMLTQLGMKVTHIRPMLKMATPQDFDWHWPKSFYDVYFPKLVEMGYINNAELQECFKQLTVLEQNPNTTLCCPLMVEVVAEKL